MNQKQLMILIVLGLVVGGLGIYLYQQQKESYGTGAAGGGRVITDFPLNEVAQLEIKTATNTITLAQEEDLWKVRERWGYPADFEKISRLLRTVWELEPVQEVMAGPSQFGRLGLASPVQGGENTGTLLTFKNEKGEQAAALMLGETFSRESSGGPFGGGGSMPMGRYVMVPGEEPDVWLVDETFSNATTDPKDWLSKDFFKVEKVKSVSLTRPGNPTNSWTLYRESESGEWKMADLKEGENFDPATASSLNYAFSSSSFNDIASPELTQEQTGMDEPVVAKLETFEGFTYTVNIGSETNDNVFVTIQVDGDFPKEGSAPEDEKPEDKERLDKEFQEELEKKQEKLKYEERLENWTYLVSKWTVDSVLKDRGEFLSEPEKENPETTGAEPEAKPEAKKAGPVVEVLPPQLQDLPPVPTSNIPAAETAEEDSTPEIPVKTPVQEAENADPDEQEQPAATP